MGRKANQAKDQGPRRKHRGDAQAREPYTNHYSGECIPPPSSRKLPSNGPKGPPLCYIFFRNGRAACARGGVAAPQAFK